LQECAQALVKHLDAAFARIWTLNEGSDVLELKASAGIYTHINGSHSRITIGDKKIGAIAFHRKPHLSNDVQNDPVVDREWARQEGMVAFAGHPLEVGGRLVGVMGLFAQHSLTDEAMTCLSAVADSIAIGIARINNERALAESQEVFHQLAQHVREIFWISAPYASKIYYVSPAYKEIFGRPGEELYEDPMAFMKYMYPEDRHIIEDQLKLIGAAGKQETQLEFRIVKPDGSIRWLAVSSFPILDNEGNVVRACGTTRDITERKEAERRVSEFYSMVSHELRTPLTSIKAALGLIAGGITGESSETTELIEIALGESDRLVRLINEILDMRKIEAGKLEFKIEPCSAAAIVSAALVRMKNVAEEARIRLHGRIADCLPILADRERAMQVLDNLLSNAIKFSPPDSEVEVSVTPSSDNMVRFSVKDQGHGIPKDQHHKLFGLFQQLDSSDSRAKGGTGLGLAISKAIIQEHGGTIGFDSAVGEGSTFWFELPTVPEGGGNETPSANKPGSAGAAI
jgi:PAS domain S-box-containing protein